MTGFMRLTTNGYQATVFDCYAIRDALKARGYRYGELPRPSRVNGCLQYGAVQKGWYSRVPADDNEAAYLKGLGVSLTEITLDHNGAISAAREL